MIHFKQRYLIILGLFVFCASCSEQNNLHIGKWHRSNNQGESVVIQFSEDGFYNVFVGNQSAENKANEKEQILLKYKFDYSTDPIKFHLYQEDDRNVSEAVTNGIVKFIGKDTMRLLLYTSATKSIPNDFSGENFVDFSKIDN